MNSMNSYTYCMSLYLQGSLTQGPPTQGPLTQGSLFAGGVVGVVLGGLVLLALLVFIAICVGVVLYGYKHPTSKIGLFMIEVCVTYACYIVCV